MIAAYLQRIPHRHRNIVFALFVSCWITFFSGAASAAVSWKNIATFTTLTNNQMCYTDGTNIVCDSSAPTLSGGNVGIGTTLPTQTLDVNGPIKIESASGFAGAAVSTIGSDPNWGVLIRGDSKAVGTFGVASSANVALFTIQDGGNVGIGTVTPGALLDVYTTSAATSGASYGVIVQGPQTVADTGTYYGIYDNPTYTAATGNTLAALDGLITNPGNTSTGTVTNLRGVYTTPSNSGGGTVLSFLGDQVVPSNSSGTVTSMYGVYSNPVTSGTAVTTTTYGTVSTPQLIGSGALTTVYGEDVDPYATAAASGTITNQYGVYIRGGNASTSGAVVTNYYQLFLASPLVTGSISGSLYGIYQQYASEKNYFAGNVGIGTTSPASLLHVNGVETVGLNGGTGGQITLNGATSGSVALKVAAAAGTGTVFQLPANNGTNTYVLQTNGSGVTSWVASSSSFTGLSTGDLCTAASGTAIACASTLSGDVTSAGGTATVTTVAKIQGTTVSGTTGSTDVVFSTSPTLTGTVSAVNLTLSGEEALTLGSDYTTTGSQNDVNLGAVSAVRYNGAATATFQGIVAGANGQLLYIHNPSSYTLTLSNLSGSESTTANRIITGTGADLPIPTNTSVTMQYDATSQKWRVTGSSNSGNTLAAGSTGQVQFNGGTNLAANANFFWDNTNSRLAIGTSAAPLSTLDIYGGIAVGTSYAGVTAAPTNGMIVQGNVGIGTTSPVHPLEVDHTDTGTTSNSGTYTAYTLSPASNETGTQSLNQSAIKGSLNIPVSNSHNSSGAIAGSFIATNESAATVGWALEGVYGSATSSAGLSNWTAGGDFEAYLTGGTTSAEVVGVYSYAETDTGTTTTDLLGGDTEAYLEGGTTSNGVVGEYGYARVDSGTTPNLTPGDFEGEVTGGTVTDAYGVYTGITSTGGTITNYYGVYIDTNATATNKWGLYQNDATAKNYFAGNVGIGTTSPATGMKVDINGPVKVAGTGSEACTASTVGGMRYNATGNYMEICSYP